MNKFHLWSGLKINFDKTYMTVFGMTQKKSTFVDELKIKWCVEFKLLGIYFDSTLLNMQSNYEKAVESGRKELHSWNYMFLTVFEKITVINLKLEAEFIEMDENSLISLPFIRKPSFYSFLSKYRSTLLTILT